MNKENFLDQGYDIIAADNVKILTDIREKIFEYSKQMVEYKGESIEDFFNYFHRYNLTGTTLNERRMKVIGDITQNLNIGKSVAEAFKNTLLNLIGPDILVQKTTNLVIHQPGDPNMSVTHRDSPLNSPFEVVVWVPLNDCYGTKGMYVCDRHQSQEALDIISDETQGFEKFDAFARENGTKIDVPFGSALFFWPGLMHGVPINTEDETRWSLNMRYKNLFSPIGSKGLTEFFDILTLSPLAQLALEHEREAAA